MDTFMTMKTSVKNTICTASSWTNISSPIYIDPNNYVKLYDYTKIFVEFYIANTNQRQGLHHASRAAADKTLPPAAAAPMRVAAARRQ